MTNTPVMAPPEEFKLTPPLHRMSVEFYEALIAEGLIGEDDAVELLEGVIVDKMTKNPGHILTVEILRDAFPPLLPSGWFINSEQPVKMADSMPEPDCSIVRGQRRDFVKSHTTLQDLGLIVEVSDTTLQRDRVDKKRVYARAGVPVYWIVNLPERQIEVYTQPVTENDIPTYREQKNYSEKDTLPVMIDGKEVGRLTVAELLP